MRVDGDVRYSAAAMRGRLASLDTLPVVNFTTSASLRLNVPALMVYRRTGFAQLSVSTRVLANPGHMPFQTLGDGNAMVSCAFVNNMSASDSVPLTLTSRRKFVAFTASVSCA